MALVFTDENFEKEALKSSVPVLVDFWAPWCGPCRKMGPMIDELAAELDGKKIKIGKMNVDENQTTPAQFDIMSIPTLIVFKNGGPIMQFVGLQTKSALLEKLKEAMN